MALMINKTQAREVIKNIQMISDNKLFEARVALSEIILLAGTKAESYEIELLEAINKELVRRNNG